MVEALGTCPTCEGPVVGDCSLPPSICPVRVCRKCGGSGMACAEHGQVDVWYSALGETIDGLCQLEHGPDPEVIVHGS